MDIEHAHRDPQQVVALRENVPWPGLTDFFGRAIGEAAAAIQAAGLTPAGPPLAIYYGQPGATVDVAAGFPVTEKMTPPSGMQFITLAGGATVEATYAGPYDQIGDAYSTLAQFLEQEHLRRGPLMWEQYLVGPDADPDPAKWRTRVVFPVA